MENLPQTRDSADIQDFSSSFLIDSTQDPSIQYYSLYGVRISSLRDVVLDNASQKWGSDVPNKRLVNLQMDDHEICVICGVLYKQQENKPNILREFCEEFDVPVQQKVTKFISDSDEIILEDELRIRLIGNMDISQLVSGMVLAVKGHQGDEGKFVVEDICFPQRSQLPRSISFDENRFIIVASGLNLSVDSLTLSVRMFTDWITGWSGSGFDGINIGKIIHVILAGNVISSVPDNLNSVISNSSIDIASDLNHCLSKIDDFLCDLSQCVHTTLMPGPCDPTNIFLPQQPLHRCMFPKAAANLIFRTTTNPYMGSTDGVRIIGTSGQNIEDIILNSSFTNPVDALECSFRCGLIAPTCPDTLPCFPFSKEDPFVLNESPHIYFAGNQSIFGSKKVKWTSNGSDCETLLVSVPNFSKTKNCVLINIKDMECNLINMNSEL